MHFNFRSIINDNDFLLEDTLCGGEACLINKLVMTIFIIMGLFDTKKLIAQRQHIQNEHVINGQPDPRLYILR